MTLPISFSDPRKWTAYVKKTFHHSSLYSHLYKYLLEDSDISQLLTYVDKDQPIPILFFSVVNFLILRDTSDTFAQFYPYLNPSPRPAAEAYPYFRQFCLLHRDEIQQLLSNARLQTNEVTRCANLLPAFELVSQRSGRRPLALIEMGASAGLNLNWNRFGYHYSMSTDHGISTVGDLTSPVQVHCSLEGDHLLPLPETLPLVARCQGIELFPLDIHKEANVRWLRACIWPEELERYFLLDAAVNVAQLHHPPIFAGDAYNLLPAILATIPPEETLCLWHSFALNQGPAHVRESIEQTLVHASATRSIYRISLEVDPTQEGRPRLELFTYYNRTLARSEWLANCALHGEQMEWRLPAYTEE